jgi:hypothetical protein
MRVKKVGCWTEEDGRFSISASFFTESGLVYGTGSRLRFSNTEIKSHSDRFSVSLNNGTMVYLDGQCIR